MGKLSRFETPHGNIWLDVEQIEYIGAPGLNEPIYGKYVKVVFIGLRGGHSAEVLDSYENRLVIDAEVQYSL